MTSTSDQKSKATRGPSMTRCVVRIGVKRTNVRGAKHRFGANPIGRIANRRPFDATLDEVVTSRGPRRSRAPE